MVATFRDLKRSRNIVYAEHKVVSGLPKIEHTGRELDTVTLQIIVHPIIAGNLSVDARILALRLLAQTGQELNHTLSQQKKILRQKKPIKGFYLLYCI